MQKLHILKIGGNIIDDAAAMEAFLASFAQLKGPKILVHGGGKIAGKVSQALGINPDMVEGRRVTNAETLKIVTMVYGGLINKTIVALLQSFGCNALGLTGADANIIPAQKRIAGNIDFGFVGDINPDKISSGILKLLLHEDIVPVIAPLTHDGKGMMLNTNADTIANVLAIALKKDFEVHLIYCFEKPGVLKDIQNEDSLLEHICGNDYKSMKRDGVITQGMIPKLDNAFESLQKGVHSVRIMHADAIHDLVNNQTPKGTLLYA